VGVALSVVGGELMSVTLRVVLKRIFDLIEIEKFGS
jgi:hypothetical protein